MEEAIKLLKELRSITSFHGGGANLTNAVYITPAQQLRNQADEIEYREQLLRKIDEFLKDK